MKQVVSDTEKSETPRTWSNILHITTPRYGFCMNSCEDIRSQHHMLASCACTSIVSAILPLLHLCT